MIERSPVRFPAGALPGSLGQPSLPVPSLLEYPPVGWGEGGARSLVSGGR